MLIVLNTSIQSVRLVSQLERSLGLLFPILVCLDMLNQASLNNSG